MKTPILRPLSTHSDSFNIRRRQSGCPTPQCAGTGRPPAKSTTAKRPSRWTPTGPSRRQKLNPPGLVGIPPDPARFMPPQQVGPADVLRVGAVGSGRIAGASPPASGLAGAGPAPAGRLAAAAVGA